MSAIVKGRAGNSRVAGDCVNEVAITAGMRVGDVCYLMNAEITIKRTSTYVFSVNGTKVRGLEARDRQVQTLIRHINNKRRQLATRASAGAEKKEDLIIEISDNEH